MRRNKYHRLRNVELALVYGNGDFMWVEDTPRPHVQFFFNDQKGNSVHLHGHGDSRLEALLDLNMLVGKYYTDPPRMEDDS